MISLDEPVEPWSDCPENRRCWRQLCKLPRLSCGAVQKAKHQTILHCKGMKKGLTYCRGHCSCHGWWCCSCCCFQTTSPYTCNYIVYCILYIIFALGCSCSRLFNSFLWFQSPYSPQAHTVVMTEVYSVFFRVATYSTRRRVKRDETCQLMTYPRLLSSPSIWGVLSLVYWKGPCEEVKVHIPKGVISS